MQWALSPLKGAGTRPHWALGELRLGHASQPLEVIMTGGAEVGCAKAEVDGHRAAVAALVLQEVSAMLGAHLSKDKGRQMVCIVLHILVLIRG